MPKPRRTGFRITRQSLPALSFVVLGIFLMAMPFLVSHAGYGGTVLVGAAHLDPPFDKALVLVARDSVDGAFGIMLNKPLTAEQHDRLSPFLRDSGVPVFFGGPIQVSDRIFVVEQKPTGKPNDEPDIDISGWDEAIRDTPDLLALIRASDAKGEHRYRLFTGYVAWNPFQLEGEVLIRNKWRSIPYTFGLVFQTDDGSSWDGLNPKDKPRPALGPNQT